MSLGILIYLNEKDETLIPAFKTPVFQFKLPMLHKLHSASKEPFFNTMILLHRKLYPDLMLQKVLSNDSGCMEDDFQEL